MSLIGVGSGEAGDSITTVCIVDVSVSLGVGGSDEVGECITNGFNSQSDVVYISTSDGASAGDVVNHSGSYSCSSGAGIVDVSSLSLVGVGSGEACDSITTVCIVDVSVSLGVGGSDEVGECITNGFNSQSDVVHTSTLDGASAGDVVNHSMSPWSC